MRIWQVRALWTVKVNLFDVRSGRCVKYININMLDFDVPFHLVTCVWPRHLFWLLATLTVRSMASLRCLAPLPLAFHSRNVMMLPDASMWLCFGSEGPFRTEKLTSRFSPFGIFPKRFVLAVSGKGRSARPSRALRAPSADRLEVFALFFFVLCFSVFFPTFFYVFFLKLFLAIFSPPFSVCSFIVTKISQRFIQEMNRRIERIESIERMEESKNVKVIEFDERTQRTCECLRLWGFRYTEVDNCARFGQRSQFSWFELLRTVDFGSTHSPCDTRWNLNNLTCSACWLDMLTPAYIQFRSIKLVIESNLVRVSLRHHKPPSPHRFDASVLTCRQMGWAVRNSKWEIRACCDPLTCCQLLCLWAVFHQGFTRLLLEKGRQKKVSLEGFILTWREEDLHHRHQAVSSNCAGCFHAFSIIFMMISWCFCALHFGFLQIQRPHAF